MACTASCVPRLCPTRRKPAAEPRKTWARTSASCWEMEGAGALGVQKAAVPFLGQMVRYRIPVRPL